MEDNFEKFFRDKALENDIMISKKQMDLFYQYMINLIEWNKNINLTAIKDEKEIVIKHFIDSIIMSKEITGKRIIDIGSGAGFPGIPLKIINDELDVTLIDAVNKKVNFMNSIIELLNLKNIIALHVRAEDLAHENEYREKYDIAISRAVANMNTLVEYMLPFVKVGGKCICMKGPSGLEESQLAQGAIEKLGGKIEKIVDYKIQDNDRKIIYINKIFSTEQTYPRKQGKPLKEPLK